MRATARNWHAVVLADVIGSRKMRRFAVWRDQRLKKASETQRRAGLLRFVYAVTAWDEFQSVAADPQHIYQIAFDLRRRFQPAGLRIGIGIGEAHLPKDARTRINEQAGGPAFLLAREALDSLDDVREQRQGRLTQVRCRDTLLEDLGNLIFGLQDSLLQNVRARQWATIEALLERKSQEAAARRLGVDKSTVSRNLRRAQYWSIESSIDGAGKLFRQLLHASVQL